MGATESGVTALLEVVLAEQHQMSAVELFSELHEVGLAGGPKWYRDLMPASLPGPGQQYGFEVDLDACTGCKACVTACHRANGLDEAESWRSAGGAAQVVTTSCHHCVEPACLVGCPVNAYEKDPATGIVVHLDDQCIGCGYCTITCPFDVPAYNHRLGIVRKCDMCRGRLAAGEAPACVQGCPNGAIRVAVVGVGDLRGAAGRGRFLAGAPAPSRTVPSTTFRSRRPPELESAMLAEWTSPEAVFAILARLSAGRPCDITGIEGYAYLSRAGGVQWPYPAGGGYLPGKERRLFEDGRFYHPDGRARFVWEDPRAGPEQPSAEWPFRLLTGRGSSAQWHTGTRTSKSAVLRQMAPVEAYVQISPTDARPLGISEGDWVEVSTIRGATSARATLTSCVEAGQIFLPMHYEGTNRLTMEVVDPYSRQPSFKDGAAAIRRLSGPRPD